MAFLDFVRAALACYFTFVAVFYTAKLLALKASTGKSYADPGPRGTLQYVAHRTFVIFRLLIWAICIARVALPAIDYWLVPFLALYTIPVAALGLAFLVASISAVVYVHTYMGAAWRSGVGRDGPTMLITDGPFGVIRHPLFAAIGLGQIGFFLAFPSLFSLICLVVGIVALVVQARYEEQQMERAFEDRWRAYARAVPALIPRGGRPPPHPTGA